MYMVRLYYLIFVESSVTQTTIQRILGERCDGNRNIVHACISMAAPINNKDTDFGKFCYKKIEKKINVPEI